jgi:2-C-methyl-D-erythritol 4-phosphate cytidylyltransferase
MDKIAVIVAGGSGKRMGSEIPKQFLLLGGQPVLMRTMRAFHDYDPEITIITVLPADQVRYWETLCRNYRFNIPHKIVPGGKSRHDSVKNAVAAISPGAIVAVHDGVRPLVSVALIQTCFDTAAILGNAIPVIDIPESIRRVDGEKSKSADRSAYRLVQTPQVFRSELLIRAFRQPYDPSFTDEANLVEADGNHIYLVKGQPSNIKLTTTLDIQIAEAILESGSDE